MALGINFELSGRVSVSLRSFLTSAASFIVKEAPAGTQHISGLAEQDRPLTSCTALDVQQVPNPILALAGKYEHEDDWAEYEAACEEYRQSLNWNDPLG